MKANALVPPGDGEVKLQETFQCTVLKDCPFSQASRVH